MNITTTTKKIAVRRFTLDLDEAEARAIIADPAAFARQLKRQLNGRANGASATTKAAPKTGSPKADKATCPICKKRLAPWFLNIHLTRKHPTPATAAAAPGVA